MPLGHRSVDGDPLHLPVRFNGVLIELNGERCLCLVLLERLRCTYWKVEVKRGVKTNVYRGLLGERTMFVFKPNERMSNHESICITVPPLQFLSQHHEDGPAK